MRHVVGVALRGHPSLEFGTGVATEGHPYKNVRETLLCLTTQ